MTLRLALPSLTPSLAFAALAGAVVALMLPTLPSLLGLVLALAMGALLLCWTPGRWLGAGLAGAAWLLLAATERMESRLPEALAAQDLQIVGRVEGLPDREPEVLRFDFRVSSAPVDAPMLQGQLLRVAWYRTTASVEAGSAWQLTLRLKPPRGVRNPGGFDFERWALQRGVAATGYVRESPDNRVLHAASGVDALRSKLSTALWAAMGGDGPLHRESRYLRALAVADTRGLDEQDWEVLRATGLSHLIAISGLHVGLVAGFAALLMRLLYRGLPGLGLRLPLPISAALAALVAAFGYAALAGFGLPTLRTVAMLAAVVLAVLSRRAQSTWQVFALALLVLLLLDPLGILGAGFWLSFAGVGWLLWCLPGRETHWLRWRSWLHVQWVASLALLPLTVWFFGQASLLGFAVNLLAVPWVTLVVVPLDLLATAALMVSLNSLAKPLLMLSAWAMNTPMQWLSDAPQWPLARLFLPEPDGLNLMACNAGGSHPVVAARRAWQGAGWLLAVAAAVAAKRGTAARTCGCPCAGCRSRIGRLVAYRPSQPAVRHRTAIRYRSRHGRSGGGASPAGAGNTSSGSADRLARRCRSCGRYDGRAARFSCASEQFGNPAASSGASVSAGRTLAMGWRGLRNSASARAFSVFTQRELVCLAGARGEYRAVVAGRHLIADRIPTAARLWRCLAVRGDSGSASWQCFIVFCQLCANGSPTACAGLGRLSQSLPAPARDSGHGMVRERCAGLEHGGNRDVACAPGSHRRISAQHMATGNSQILERATGRMNDVNYTPKRAHCSEAKRKGTTVQGAGSDVDAFIER
jgi:ComEC/Rec2-related protein